MIVAEDLTISKENAEIEIRKVFSKERGVLNS